MIDQIESMTVSIIKQLNEIIEIKDSCSNILFSVSRPSDFIEKIDDIEKNIKRIESIMMFIPSLLERLQKQYITDIMNICNLKKSLIETVEQAENKNESLVSNNINFNIDNDMIISEITICKNNDYDKNVDNICIDTIIDAKEYTLISIIQRLKTSDDMILNEIIELFKLTTSKLNDIVKTQLREIIDLKELLHDGQTISDLNNDNNGVYENIRKYILAFNAPLQIIRDHYKKLFQTYVSINNNYLIYKQVVKSFNTMALESVFDDSPYMF